jgi:hypothetical protein
MLCAGSVAGCIVMIAGNRYNVAHLPVTQAGNPHKPTKKPQQPLLQVRCLHITYEVAQ